MSPLDKAKLEVELGALLNRYSAELPSNTADFILAAFLMQCLDAFNDTLRLREKALK